jgi:hypothetical protein
MSIRPSTVAEVQPSKSIRPRPSLFSKATNFYRSSKQEPGGSTDTLTTQDTRRRTANGNLRRCRITHSLGRPTRPRAQPKASSKGTQSMDTSRHLRKQRRARARTPCFRTEATSCLRSCHLNTSRKQSVSRCKCQLATMPTSERWPMRRWRGSRNSHGSVVLALRRSSRGKKVMLLIKS